METQHKIALEAGTTVQCHAVLKSEKLTHLLGVCLDREPLQHVRLLLGRLNGEELRREPRAGSSGVIIGWEGGRGGHGRSGMDPSPPHPSHGRHPYPPGAPPKHPATRASSQEADKGSWWKTRSNLALDLAPAFAQGRGRQGKPTEMQEPVARASTCRIGPPPR